MLCAVPIPGASQALFETNTWIGPASCGPAGYPLANRGYRQAGLSVLRIGGASGKRLQKAQSFIERVPSASAEIESHAGDAQRLKSLKIGLDDILHIQLAY
jgi:hypothetical protein